MTLLQVPPVPPCPSFCRHPAGHDAEPGPSGEVRRVHTSEPIGVLEFGVVELEQFETVAVGGAVTRSQVWFATDVGHGLAALLASASGVPGRVGVA